MEIERYCYSEDSYIEFELYVVKRLMCDQAPTANRFEASDQHVRRNVSTYYNRFFYRRFTANIRRWSRDGSHRTEALH